MDAFYASVEQRDDPGLRGRPVVVAWQGPRAVVCAASYEARRYGVHSAMPASRAARLCPDAVFLPPDFPRYRAVSQQVRAIFRRYTELVEPLSLDEAYLDVTRNLAGLATATRVARAIRADIRASTGLTASAGVAPNKFLAKIASDWRKPDGLFVIQPHEALEFLAPLAVGKLPGVGRATAAVLGELGITTVADLRHHDETILVARFGKFGRRLHHLARGLDPRPVEPHQPRQSLSTETTFAEDRPLAALEPTLDDLAARVWRSLDAQAAQPHTVFIKLKTREFRLLTRSFTPPQPPTSLRDLQTIARGLLARVDLPRGTLYRLVGVGVANFKPRIHDSVGEQAGLFTREEAWAKDNREPDTDGPPAGGP